jgi:methylmalonyl-CoA mutase
VSPGRPLRDVMTQKFALADGFDDPDMSAWEALAQKALKGAPLDKLTATTYDGIAIKPLYTRSDIINDHVGISAPSRDAFLPWDIRQTVLDKDPVIANQVALADLERGVSSIEFHIDHNGRNGVCAQTPDDFATLIKGILTSLATIALHAPDDPIGAARALADAIKPSDRPTAKLAFNLNPIAPIITGGASLQFEPAAQFAKDMLIACPAATALRADARPIHEGGGSDAQELAVLIASGIAHLKAGEAAGMTPAQVNQTLVFTLSVGPDVVVEIAKLKAARRLWARILDACGETAPMKLQAVTSARMQSIADPWTNILRATCAAFGAGAGGADIVTVLPFTSAYALADERARRIARNTQLILQEESYLGAVADPAAGAWAMEAVSEDLARVAWGLVQEIERAGGLQAALGVGLVQGWVATTRAARERDIAKRKTALVGVSVFPNLNEAMAPLPPFGDSGAVIPAMRLSAPFEALRAKPEQAIFLATLGPIAKFNARSGFAKNVFEAGGIKALGGDDVHAGDQTIVAAFTKSGAKIACLCGDDDTYQLRAAPLAQALKHAGAKVVWLAGKGEYQGVDRILFAGADILAELTFAHRILEGEA